MKFAIDLGHGVSYDSGAVGVRKEEDCINPVGALVIQKLQSLGHSVVAVRPSGAVSLVDSLRQRTAKANSENADVYVSIHFNCGGGRGAEVFAVSDAGRKIAQPVLDEIVKLGYINRGLKEAHFFVLVHTDMPAILIEGSFLDSAEDMAMYNAEDYANAIVKGLTGQTAKVVPATPEKKSGIVTASVLNVRKGPGTNYAVIGTLKRGTSVKIDRKDGDWYSIFFGDHGGYVSAQYIK